MRVLAGLTPPTRGTALVGGHRYRDIPNPATQVGVLLDASAQHAGRTGREVLDLAAITMGLPRRRVDEMLERVSLTPKEAKRRIRNYSLGMRQRLGIAHALMGDPKVLVLDEPANGLDPAGIHWMRGLLREYADRGGTVLLSSHLLHEIEVVADDLVVIGNGRVVAQGATRELLRTAGTFVRAADPAALATALATAGITTQDAHDGGVRTETDPERVGRVAAAAGDRAGRAASRRGPRPRGDVPRAHRGEPTRHRTARPDRPAHPPDHRSVPMSTATLTKNPSPADVPGSIDVSQPRVPLHRLVAVEARKLVDTRAGSWLVALMVLANLLVIVGLVVFAPDEMLTFEVFFGLSTAPAELPAAGAGDPAGHQRVVAALGADHLRPRAPPRPRGRGQAARRPGGDRRHARGGRRPSARPAPPWPRPRTTSPTRGSVTAAGATGAGLHPAARRC